MNRYQIVIVGISVASATIGAAPYHHRYSISQVVPRPHKLHHIRGRIIPQEMWNNPCAATMWGEARNQPDPGRIAVCHVIKNRVKAHRKKWGYTFRKAAFKRKQFSWLNRNDPGLASFKHMMTLPANHPDRILWEHLKDLSRHLGKDNTGGATSYVTNNWHTYWLYSQTVIGVMYDHTFFREKTKEEWKAYYRDQKANRQLAKARKIAHKANRCKHVKAKNIIKHHVKHR